MTHYVGILDGSGDVWGIRIPDCPGACGAGADPDNTFGNAIAGLAAWAAATLKDGDALPVARSLAEIAEDAAARPEPGELAIMIPLLIDAGRTVRAKITMDAACSKRSIGRPNGPG